MSVRAIQQQTFRRQLVFVLDGGLYVVAEKPGDADQIERYHHDPRAAGVFNGERLGEQVLRRAFGRFLARRVPGHPHRLLGRDVRRGDADLPVRRRVGCDAERSQRDYDCERDERSHGCNS